jgi:ribosome maturation factor RimP
MHEVGLKVRRIIEPVITAMGYELVGVEYVGQGGRPTLRVYVDAPAGITLDDCQRVSGHIGALLDVEDPLDMAYNLEVSSPGLDRPLFEAKHFVQFTGRMAKIRMKFLIDGRRKFTGVIQGVQDGAVIILENDQEVVLPLAHIGKAHLVPNI